MAFDIKELTSGCPKDTSGVFEQLLSSVMKHVQDEYDNQRIRGSEYSQVYLNALQTTMQQAIQWHLGIETTKAQVQLIESQIVGQDKQNLLLDEQRLMLQAQTSLVDQQRLQAVEQTALIQQQSANLSAEAQNIPKQGLVLDEQHNRLVKENAVDGLVDSQIEAVKKQVDLTVQQKTNLTSENLNIPKQGLLIDAQKDATLAGKLNTDEQTQLVTEQVVSAAYNNTDLLPVQKAKSEAEVSILDQKLVTEEAQTKTTTSQGALGGILGSQRELYDKQRDGFDRDAEQKATRIVTDIWGVLASTTDNVPAPDSIHEDRLENTLNELKANAGLL